MADTNEYLSKIITNNAIDPALFAKYNVKRGLRNSDGTGVLVGLTRIGDVHGYIIDEGEKVAIDGKLFYRGIDVEAIVSHAAREGRFAFEECVYLLLFGVLPSGGQLDAFSQMMGNNRELPPHFVEDAIMKSPSADIMNKLSRSVLTLYSYDKSPDDHSPENVLRQCIELIAQFPTIIAASYRAKRHYFDKQSLILHTPDSNLSTAETLLSLIRRDQKFSKAEAEILDLALVLHAEHGGGNNSTFSVHLVSSADTDTFAAITAGINSLKGSKHGGANVKVVEMMEEIKTNIRHWDDEDEISEYLKKIMHKEAGDGSGLVYGQGHAVYTKSDPRARLLREKAESLAAQKNLSDEFNLYKLVEKVMPEAFKAIKGGDKEICTNVDFYSGFVYNLLGIPTELFTPIFAVSRVAGWCAHRIEEIVSGGKIIRPAYKCVQKRLPYTEISAR